MLKGMTEVSFAVKASWDSSVLHHPTQLRSKVTVLFYWPLPGALRWWIWRRTLGGGGSRRGRGCGTRSGTGWPPPLRPSGSAPSCGLSWKRNMVIRTQLYSGTQTLRLEHSKDGVYGVLTGRTWSPWPWNRCWRRASSGPPQPLMA